MRLRTGVLAILLAGCGGPVEPQLAAGKPVAHWLAALPDPDPKVRKDAAFTLGNVGPVDPAVVPGLTAALTDPDDAVRYQAVVALVKIGPAAGETVPVLARLNREDRNPRVRAVAGRALEKLRPAEGQAGGSPTTDR